MIRIIRDSNGLMTVINDKLGLASFGFHNEVALMEIPALAAELFLSPEEVGKVALICGAADPQAQAAALGVHFIVR